MRNQKTHMAQLGQLSLVCSGAPGASSLFLCALVHVLCHALLPLGLRCSLHKHPQLSCCSLLAKQNTMQAAVYGFEGQQSST